MTVILNYPKIRLKKTKYVSTLSKIYHNILDFNPCVVMYHITKILPTHSPNLEGQTHHHTNTSSRLGDSSQPVGQVISDGAAHHGGVS